MLFMQEHFFYTKKFVKAKKRLSPSLQRALDAKIILLKGNRAHPSLKVHRALRTREENMWICYVGASSRLLYSINEDGIYFHDVGPHGIVDHLHA